MLQVFHSQYQMILFVPGRQTILKITLPENYKLLQLIVVLVSKGILEEYQFLVVLPDKTCMGFKSDI